MEHPTPTRAVAGGEWDGTVRRRLLFIEQSIEASLSAYVFQPNVAETWAAVQSAVSHFLTTLWADGKLQGLTAADAFIVQCGLGTTMTADDILNGRLVLVVGVAVLDPAEFVTLTFQQTMQTS